MFWNVRVLKSAIRGVVSTLLIDNATTTRFVNYPFAEKGISDFELVARTAR